MTFENFYEGLIYQSMGAAVLSWRPSELVGCSVHCEVHLPYYLVKLNGCLI